MSNRQLPIVSSRQHLIDPPYQCELWIYKWKQQLKSFQWNATIAGYWQSELKNVFGKIWNFQFEFHWYRVDIGDRLAVVIHLSTIWLFHYLTSLLNSLLISQLISLLGCRSKSRESFQDFWTNKNHQNHWCSPEAQWWSVAYCLSSSTLFVHKWSATESAAESVGLNGASS